MVVFEKIAEPLPPYLTVLCPYKDEDGSMMGAVIGVQPNGDGFVRLVSDYWLPIEDAERCAIVWAGPMNEPISVYDPASIWDGPYLLPQLKRPFSSIPPAP